MGRISSLKVINSDKNFISLTIKTSQGNLELGKDNIINKATLNGLLFADWNPQEKET